MIEKEKKRNYFSHHGSTKIVDGKPVSDPPSNGNISEKKKATKGGRRKPTPPDANRRKVWEPGERVSNCLILHEGRHEENKSSLMQTEAAGRATKGVNKGKEG